MKSPSRQMAGFTLIEVIVALFILSFALVSSIQLFKNTSHGMVFLKQHQVAHWVGMNYLTQQQIDPSFPKIGITSSKTEMLGKTWYVDAQVIKTPDENIRKILVQVFDKKGDKEPIFSANGYKSRLIQW